MILHLVEDEHGQPWYVAKGDPAFTLIQKLRAAYYTWIVMPVELLTMGELGLGTQMWLEPRATLRKIHSIRYNKDREDEVRRLYRLAEVLSFLSGA